jgi:hypothetical protein
MTGDSDERARERSEGAWTTDSERGASSGMEADAAAAARAAVLGPAPPATSARPPADDVPPARKGGKPAGPAESHRDPKVFVLERELSEVHLLLDNVSANPNTTVAELMSETATDDQLDPDWIEQVCRISWPPEGSAQDKAEDAALLIKAKDHLNRLSHPASGSTIAFTLLVTQEEGQDESIWRRMNGDRSDPEPSPTRSSLAQTAYPDLLPKAVKFRKAMRWISISLVAALLITCLLSWYVAYGNAALAELKTAEAALADSSKRVSDAEAASDKPPPLAAEPTGTAGKASPEAGRGSGAGAAPAVPIPAGTSRAVPAGTSRAVPAGTSRAVPAGTSRVVPAGTSGAVAIATSGAVPAKAGGTNEANASAKDADASVDSAAAAVPFVAYCERPFYSSAAQLQACNAQKEDLGHVKRVQTRLAGWVCWFCLEDVSRLEQEAIPVAAPAGAGADSKKDAGTPPAVVQAREYNDNLLADAPSRAAALANIMGSAVLPFLYGLLGAGASIIRSLSRKIRASLLSPRDLHLSFQQLALGAVVGACIGLFVAAPGSGDEGDSLLGPVALSASAISFVAGFGVEAVFQALEALITRIFNITQAPTGNRGDGVAST